MLQEKEQKLLEKFQKYLQEQERSPHTINKYLHDVRLFLMFIGTKQLAKKQVIIYKERLQEKYAPSSVNSMIAAVNTYLSFLGRTEIRVKPLKIQKALFRPVEKELNRGDYYQLVNAAKSVRNERLMLIIETICSTGIRVSELRFITVQAVRSGRAEINCKGKHRIVFLTPKLCKLLRAYISKKRLQEGPVFLSRNGKDLNRSSVWRQMKSLSGIANVACEKIFPHNLRHLFARTFYSAEKDISRLADILGHSSINTTRIYTAESGEIHAKRLEHLGLVIKGFAT